MATRYLIDTNIWIDALGGVTDAVAIIDSDSDIAMSAITYAEVASGCTPTELASFDGFLNADPSVLVLHTNTEIIKLAAAFNHNTITGRGYGYKRLPDAIIGATGVVTGRTILTRNLADFFACRQVKVEIPYQGRWLDGVGVRGEKTKVWVSTI